MTAESELTGFGAFALFPCGDRTRLVSRNRVMEHDQVSYRVSEPVLVMEARPASRRATGTRNGEQET